LHPRRSSVDARRHLRPLFRALEGRVRRDRFQDAEGASPMKLREFAGDPSCTECQECCFTQRFCATCSEPTVAVKRVATGDGAKVYGTAKIWFWLCRACGV